MLWNRYIFYSSYTNLDILPGIKFSPNSNILSSVISILETSVSSMELSNTIKSNFNSENVNCLKKYLVVNIKSIYLSRIFSFG